MSLLFRMFVALLLLMSFLPTAAKDVPRPKLKPVDEVAPLPETRAPKDIVFPAEVGEWPEDVVSAERTKCRELLAGLKIDFEPLAPVGGPLGCGAAAPILIKTIRGTLIVPPAEVTCRFAEQLHGWVTSSVQPSAHQYLGRELVQIDNASAYVCRRRNNSSNGKLSEHAKANAFDIARLRFSGDGAITVTGDWSGLAGKVGVSKKAEFLARIRRDACIHFTTVLGPGSDRHHGDHFHVDYAFRKGGYRICK